MSKTIDKEDFKNFLEAMSKSILEERKNSPIIPVLLEKVNLHMQRGKSYSSFAVAIRGFKVLEVNTAITHVFNKIFELNNSNDKYYMATRGIRTGELWTFLENYFKSNEGLGCSVDKVRFVINRIGKAIENNECQDFISSYADVGRPDMDKKGEVPYWCPETLKDTDQILELYKNYTSYCKNLFVNKKFLNDLTQKLGDKNEYN